MGEARTEQKDRQAPEPEETVQIERVMRRNARKVARSQRRGYFGLAKAIMKSK